MKGIALCLVFGFFALQSQPLLAQTNNKKAVEEELSGIRGEKQRLSQQLSKDQEVIQKYQKLIYTTKQKYQQE